MSSCIVSKKQFEALNQELTKSKSDMAKLRGKLDETKDDLSECRSMLSGVQASKTSEEKSCQDKVKILNDQLEYQRNLMSKESEGANALVESNRQAQENLNKTLDKLAQKEEYIDHLQAAKTKADSINLALSFNLKTVLKDGIDDEDINVKVDKTVVMIDIADDILFKSGSYQISDKADEVLKKISLILQEKEGFDVMVEGYTDNIPMKSACIKDNWELSVLRSAAMVKSLQTKHNIDPNRLIAAGRGQYNAKASNDTAEGRKQNRRIRVIIMPKIDQFYDLLAPDEE